MGQALKEGVLNVLRSPDVFPSLGFGVIRAVDVGRNLFYVITDADEDTLAGVNCLTVGSTVRLPNGVLAGQGSAAAEQPYTSKKQSKCLLATPWQRYSKPRTDN
jgi:hypothetical protein